MEKGLVIPSDVPPGQGWMKIQYAKVIMNLTWEGLSKIETKSIRVRNDACQCGHIRRS